jgi:predicted ATPase
MRFTRLRLENWKNFREVDVGLRDRTILIGANASGKTNLFDALRFLCELADPKGGLQNAVAARDGVSQIRSLHARRYPSVAVDVDVRIEENRWRYRLEFGQDNQRLPKVQKEQVWKDGRNLLYRPNKEDKSDSELLSQTALEQVNLNKEFRDLRDGLNSVRYRNIIPQLVREPERFLQKSGDPYGTDFLEQIANLPEKTRNSRLRKILDQGLKVAVPNLHDMKLEKDVKGVPHLVGLYTHWRPNAGWQREGQFSDGTLRLLGLFWSLLDGKGPLLLEEPELNLHKEIIVQLPKILARLTRKNGRQILVSTHSAEMIGEGVDPSEVLFLEPAANGTIVRPASDASNIREQVDAGFSLADVVLPLTAPKQTSLLAEFGD